MTPEENKDAKRVFWLDDECYIIYLGSDKDDFKPFMRLGGPMQLHEQLDENVYNIVLTSSYTGNPVREADYIEGHPNPDVRYIGDVETVRKFEQYLKKRDIDLPSIVNYRKIKGSDERSVVYFFDDGNISIQYEDEVLFDLYERERKDLHFIQQSIRIKKLYSKNPLRYPSRIFKNTSFLRIDNSVLFASYGKLISFGLPEDYFVKLAHHGVDPDSIAAVVTDTVSENLVQLVKRKVHTDTGLTILSSNDEIKPMIELVAGKSRKEKGIEFKKIKEAGSELFGSKITPAASGIQIKIKDDTFIIKSAPDSSKESVEPKRVDILPSQKVVVFRSEDSGKTIGFSHGVPIVFTQNNILPADLIHDYENLCSFLKRNIPAVEYTALSELSKVFEGILREKKLSTIFKAVKGRLKKLSARSNSLSYFALHHALNITEYYLENNDKIPDTEKTLSSLEKVLRKLISGWNEPEEAMPAVCDCYNEEGRRYFFYRIEGMPSQLETYDFDSTVYSEIEKMRTERKVLFEEERARLFQLLVSTEIPISSDAKIGGKLPEKEAAVPSGEELSGREAQGADKGKEDETSGGREKAETELLKGGARDEAPEIKMPFGRKQKKEDGEGASRKLLIPAIVFVILLGAGIPLLLLQPWKDGEDRSGEGGGPSAEKGGEDGTASDTETGNKRETGTAAEENGRDAQKTEGTQAEDTDTADGEEAGTGEQDRSEASEESEGRTDGTASGTETDDTDAAERRSESAEETRAAGRETGTSEDDGERPLRPEEGQPVYTVEDRENLSPYDTQQGIPIWRILEVSNQIATANGYWELTPIDYIGKNPNIIYAGLEFTMPDGSTYTVKKGDYIWSIAIRYIKGEI